MHPGRFVTDNGARTVVWLSATLNVLFWVLMSGTLQRDGLFLRLDNLSQ